jgi:hypothetical protein
MSIILFMGYLMVSFESISQPSKVGGIRAYNIDYNWDQNGGYINSFAKPGLWADADPEELMEWYEDLGCNAVHSFAVSCNGYAWYKNGTFSVRIGDQRILILLNMLKRLKPPLLRISIQA